MAQVVPAAALMLLVPAANSKFMAWPRRPAISLILLCAAAFCLMSRLARPNKQETRVGKRIGVIGAPGEEAG
jgi:hypothetical protein